MQEIWVFQQRGSGEEKIRGIEVYGKDLQIARVVSIDQTLPPIIDEPEEYIPKNIQADLVLDFLQHPDLSQALARICSEHGIPVIASGKKIKMGGVFIPPT